MSLLAPLFALGIAAVTVPILLHLIRRVPRGRFPFSSLMFLAPSPPRLTRRSRLDQIILLLLRAAALAILALAFARPFLRWAGNSLETGARGRYLAILLDTSASVRRGDLWRQATARVEETLKGLERTDTVALFTFSDRLRTVVGFDDHRGQELAAQKAAVRNSLASIVPSWSATDLGAALSGVAEVLRSSRERTNSDSVLQIVLISDLQRGADVEALQAAEWPSDVLVSLKTLKPQLAGNAWLRVLSTEEGSEGKAGQRVRLSNAADGSREQFYIRWALPNKPQRTEDAVAVTVPPGQSRVVRLPRPVHLARADRITLSGDGCEFDNTWFASPPPRLEWTVHYVGDDGPDDPDGLQYYLRRALSESPYGTVNLIAHRPGEVWTDSLGQTPQLVVLSQAPDRSQQEKLKSYLERGGAALLVPTTRDSAVALAGFTGNAELAADGAKSGDYVMLRDVDFSHPVLAAFASPRYSDFTKIHFWSHFPFVLRDETGVRVLARFDDTFPALWEQSCGQGRVFMLASGWRPRDSQLALSSKFVPLLVSILEQVSGRVMELPGYYVDDPVQLPGSSARPGPLQVIKPDGRKVELNSAAQPFRDTDAPGIYELALAGQRYSLAVNLQPRESDTAPMDGERLEQLGVRLGEQLTASQELDRQRHLRDVELEGRQKFWRWLLVSVLGVLLVETWWADRQARSGARAYSDEGPGRESGGSQQEGTGP